MSLSSQAATDNQETGRVCSASPGLALTILGLLAAGLLSTVQAANHRASSGHTIDGVRHSRSVAATEGRLWISFAQQRPELGSDGFPPQSVTYRQSGSFDAAVDLLEPALYLASLPKRQRIPTSAQPRAPPTLTPHAA